MKGDQRNTSRTIIDPWMCATLESDAMEYSKSMEISLCISSVHTWIAVISYRVGLNKRIVTKRMFVNARKFASNFVIEWRPSYLSFYQASVLLHKVDTNVASNWLVEIPNEPMRIKIALKPHLRVLEEHMDPFPFAYHVNLYKVRYIASGSPSSLDKDTELFVREDNFYGGYGLFGGGIIILMMICLFLCHKSEIRGKIDGYHMLLNT